MTGPATAPEYDVVGELGRTGEGAAYLARERSTGELVALRDPAGAGGHVVNRALNSTIPSSTRSCPICRTAIHDWRRYCGQCGTDLSGVDVAPDGLDDREVVESVLRSIQQPVELLGSMRRSEGGGAVWFGRDRNTGEIMALDLARKETDGEAEFDVTVTARLTALERTDAAPPADAPAEKDTDGEDHASESVAPGVIRKEPSASPAADGESASGEAGERVCPSCNRRYPATLRFCPDDGSALRAAERQDSLVGEVIASRYEIQRLIGRGGMGHVYLARHVRMGRLCAIKVLNRELGNDVAMVGRFSREATNASRINHGNVAHIYDFGETPEHGVYLAMEYVEGRPLSKVIKEEAPLANERVIAIAMQVADALGAAHAEGVVHRDLTPNNIMIARAADGSERVKVVDFGIAKATQDSGSSITKTGIVIGTPQYMSPEQLLAEPVDGRSDIYSMGCVLFEMLTASQPFAGATTLNQFARRLTETPPAPVDVNPTVWPDLSALVLRALARQREDRFESAAAVRKALRQAKAPARPPEAKAAVPDVAEGATGAAVGTDPKSSADQTIETRVAPRGEEPAGSRPVPARGTPPVDATIAVPAPPRPEEKPRKSKRPTRPARTRSRLPLRWIAAAAVPVAALAIWLATRDNQPARSPAAPAAGSDPSAATTPQQTPPEEGTIRLAAALPQGAVVRANGSVVTVAGNAIRLPAGDYDLEVEMAGYLPFSERLTLESGAETPWSPRLVREQRAAPGPPAPAEQERTEPQPPPVTSSARSPVITPPAQAREDTAVTEVAQPPPVFDDVSAERIESFRAFIEAKNLSAIRPYLVAGEIERFRGIFEQAGARALRVGVRGLAPDPARLRTTFLLRIDVAGGESLMVWTDFVATFRRQGDTWGLFTIEPS